MTERKTKAAVWITTSLGAGYFPVAPGTAGSAVGLGIVLAIGQLQLDRLWMMTIVVALAAIICAVGIWAAGIAEKHFGKTDPPQVVVDEVVGQMLTLALHPDGTWKWFLTGFVLFRFFDVLKPYPARRLEHAPGGWGIMLDDVAAGIYALGALALIGWGLKFS